MEIICKIYLSNYLSYFSTFLLRIENPYTQWVWIANPDQRYGTNIRGVGCEHPRGRENIEILPSTKARFANITHDMQLSFV